MALGDVFTKNEGSWGLRRGTLRGPGPAQLGTGWLPRYADSIAPFDSHTLAMWTWPQASGSQHFPVDGGSAFATLSHFTTGIPRSHCRGPIGVPGAILIDGPSDADYHVGLTTASWGDYQYPNGVINEVMTCPQIEPSTGQLTVSAWVNMQGIAQYRDTVNDWYVLHHRHVAYYEFFDLDFELGLRYSSAGAGVSLLGEANKAAPYRVGVDVYRLPIYDWALWSVTHDGETLKFFLNGVLCDSRSCIGTISWRHRSNDPSTRVEYAVCADPWFVGSGHNWTRSLVFRNALQALIGPLWIEDIARSADYLRALYELAAPRF